VPVARDTLQIKGLGRQKLAAVAERARRLGMTPQRYLRHLVEEDLAISARAKSASFDELLGPGQSADEAEIDRLVGGAKARYRRPRKARKATARRPKEVATPAKPPGGVRRLPRVSRLHPHHH
jgi:hypothetical protein